MHSVQWVAVVDDDDSLRGSIVRLLRTVEINARGFASAEDFLRQVAEEIPTCAVVDLYLGHGLNGYELKERLDATGVALPLIFMTAHAELPLRMQQSEAAVAACLRKPFVVEDLLARLAPILDAGRAAADG